ncbi:hypothetical protein [Flavobacterium sp.]|uniref:hypothetical protein n=1 Tax=Flavobacterium sp. TaxID=239 RepID=UPI002CD39146|nr:hypothetical protein [Flavobacterium sp.]HSD08924.1 hypothetical protein [Flavobacterium sp.]
MKKALLTFGLFTLVLASTSFATPTSSTSPIADNAVITTLNIDGGQSSGGNRKLDYNGENSKINNTITSIDGGQSSGGNRKLD